MNKDRRIQKQLFESTHDFALRICYRYSGMDQDPHPYLYDGFVHLFKSIDLGSFSIEPAFLSFAKQKLKWILIDNYIRIENGNICNNDVVPNECISSFGNNHTSIISLSSKELIDTLRKLPFNQRVIFNLSIIDGFSSQDISSKLKIPVEIIEQNLKKAREHLRQSVQPMASTTLVSSSITTPR